MPEPRSLICPRVFNPMMARYICKLSAMAARLTKASVPSFILSYPKVPLLKIPLLGNCAVCTPLSFCWLLPFRCLLSLIVQLLVFRGMNIKSISMLSRILESLRNGRAMERTLRGNFAWTMIFIKHYKPSPPKLSHFVALFSALAIILRQQHIPPPIRKSPTLSSANS